MGKTTAMVIHRTSAITMAIEGPTNDSVIQQIRLRQRRNMLATLICWRREYADACWPVMNSVAVSAATTMLIVQDNEINWIELEHIGLQRKQEFLDFHRAVCSSLRREHPVAAPRPHFCTASRFQKPPVCVTLNGSVPAAA
jgi:pullulanase/glycogen debranching enzyme